MLLFGQTKQIIFEKKNSTQSLLTYNLAEFAIKCMIKFQ